MLVKGLDLYQFMIMQSQHLTKFTQEFYQICVFFLDTKKLRINLETPQLGQRDSHGKASQYGHGKSHGKMFCNIFGYPGFDT